jgi:hypothetical protein
VPRERAALSVGTLLLRSRSRELHSAELPALLRPLLMPAIEAVQSTLRERGQPLFDALAKPGIVKQILTEPYYDAEQVATRHPPPSPSPSPSP